MQQQNLLSLKVGPLLSLLDADGLETNVTGAFTIAAVGIYLGIKHQLCKLPPGTDTGRGLVEQIMWSCLASGDREGNLLRAQKEKRRAHTVYIL